MSSSDSTFNHVRLSLHALLKIIQYAREAPQGAQLSGQLLGLERDGFLEITDMFPFPACIQDGNEEEDYQLEMMKALREVNVDHNTVGWFQTVKANGSAINSALVDAQVAYQATIPGSVVLLYDHFLSCSGPPALRALSIKPSFMKEYRERKQSKASSSITGSSDILIEFPISISLSVLDQLALPKIFEGSNFPSVAQLPIPETEEIILSKAAEDILESLDEFISEANRTKHQIFNTNKHQNPGPAFRQRRVCSY